MIVRSIMLSKDKLITVLPEDTIKTALEVIEKNNLLSVPVVVGKKFYGSISKDRIYEYYYEKCPDKTCLLDDFKVENVMRTDVPAIEPQENIEKAVHFLEIKNISFVAVVNIYGEFEGIITHHAIFHEFTEVFGVNKGRRLAVIAFDIPGQVAKLTKIIYENNGNVISCVVVDPESVTDVREIVLRVKTDNYDLIVQKVKDAGFNVQ
jgi:acetoin utilization protein AcuB